MPIQTENNVPEEEIPLGERSAAVDSRELLKEKEFYGEYGLSISWQRKMRRVGGGPAFVKIGKMVRYRRADIEAYLAAHVVRHRESEESQ